MHLPPEADVHRHQNLLHRAVSVDLERAGIPRPVDELFPRVFNGGETLDDLLVGRSLKRSPPPGVDQRLHRRAVQRIEAEDFSTLGPVHVERGRVQDEEIFEHHAQPGIPLVVRAGLVEEIDALLVVLLRVGIFDRPLELGQLILARLDQESEQVVSIREATELEHGDRFTVAHRGHEVGGKRVIELPAFHLNRSYGPHGFARAEELRSRLPGEQVAQTHRRPGNHPRFKWRVDRAGGIDVRTHVSPDARSRWMIFRSLRSLQST